MFLGLVCKEIEPMQDWTWTETYSSATYVNGVVGVVIWAGVSKLKSGTGGDIADKRSDRIVCRTHTITPRNCSICWATIWHLWCPQALDCCTCPEDVCCLLFALSRQNIFILMPCAHWPWDTFPADLLTDTVGGWRLSNHKLVCSSDLCWVICG